jgi:hypothetical protein
MPHLPFLDDDTVSGDSDLSSFLDLERVAEWSGRFYSISVYINFVLDTSNSSFIFFT